jgi:hypothetical protein
MSYLIDGFLGKKEYAKSPEIIFEIKLLGQ